MSQIKAKLSTKKQSSPLSQLRKLASSAKKKKKPTWSPGTDDEEISPPEFPLANPNDLQDIPIAPRPAVFALASLSTAGELAAEEHVPTVSQAVTHLALLEVFWNYRERFLALDDDVKAFFGVALGWPAEKPWDEEHTEMLWKLVVEIAVGRFEAWWKIVGREMEAAKWDEQKTANGSRWGPGDGPSKTVTELPSEMLPPVEVLMVWHSFMLNPKCYYDDCFALGVPSMLSVAFPWEAIKNAIDLSTLSYTLPSEAEEFFKVSTSQNPDLFSQLKDASVSTPRLPLLEISCPACESEHEIQITPSGTQTGWLDPAFRLSCSCGFLINHDALCAERLRQDIKQVLSGGPGIRGTFSPPFTQGTTVNTQLKQYYVTTAPTVQSHPTVTSLLLPLGKTANAITPFYLPASPQSSSCISLTAAVLRQGTFIDKMHHFLWLRSPTLSAGTLPRAQIKYSNFFALFKMFPGETMVPTLDVDLFWHSHQLTPARYYTYCFLAAGRFIDHDDKLPTGILDDGFERTGQRYWNAFSSEYGGCLCWACELEWDEEDLGQRGWWDNRRGAKRRREWERRVTVAFWREVEKRRRDGGAPVGLSGLQKVLKDGQKPKKK
ncbi:hypothetical protein BDD12DRAFT_873115 [Trichophaea hybrida]|nr:hypothetical protein BDD12DRAFT_873115 [Trichophaea hybrida]